MSDPGKEVRRKRCSSGDGAGCMRRERRERAWGEAQTIEEPFERPALVIRSNDAVPWTRQPPRRRRGAGGRSAFLLLKSWELGVERDAARRFFFLKRRVSERTQQRERERERERERGGSVVLARTYLRSHFFVDRGVIDSLSLSFSPSFSLRPFSALLLRDDQRRRPRSLGPRDARAHARRCHGLFPGRDGRLRVGEFQFAPLSCPRWLSVRAPLLFTLDLLPRSPPHSSVFFSSLPLQITHKFRHYLLHRNKLGLLAALDSMTNEIMLLGVASLLLIMVQKNVAGLCCELFFCFCLLVLSRLRFSSRSFVPGGGGEACAWPFLKKQSAKKRARNRGALKGLNFCFLSFSSLSLFGSPNEQTSQQNSHTHTSRRGRLQAPHLARLRRRLRLLPLPHRRGIGMFPEKQRLRQCRCHEGLLCPARRQRQDLRERELLRGAAERRGAGGRRGRGEGARGRGRGRRRGSAQAPAEPLGFGSGGRARRGDGGVLRGEGRGWHRRVPSWEEAGGDGDGAPRGSR